MKTVIVRDGKRMQKDKSAIMTPATNRDRFRIDDNWKGFDSWQSGQIVEEVSHFGRHTTHVGMPLEIEDAETMEAVAQVQVVQIKMIHPQHLTTEDAQALGYNDVYEAIAEFGQRKFWLMYTMPYLGDLPAQ